MIPVLISAVQYFYEKGEFIANNDDWMDEYNNSNVTFTSPDVFQNSYQIMTKSYCSYFNFSVLVVFH